MKVGPPVHAADRELVARVSSAVASGELAAIRYLVSKGTTWAAHRSDSKVHEIDQGIELVTRSGPIVSVCWAMDGPREGLSLELRSERANASEEDLVSAIDVSDLQEWRPFLGKLLTLKGLASHVPSGTDEAMVWSARFESTNGEVVIALGELDGASLGYMPDNIVAIFDSRIARAFTIPGNQVSAWGADT